MTRAAIIFNRVLGALMSQTLPLNQWELLLIDNISKDILAKQVDLTWHPNGKHLREEKLGLISARLLGIQEAVAEILVFIDDDNVLEKDYLENTLQIAAACPFLGAWSGQSIGEFEQPPPEWAKLYLPYLTIREFKTDRWTNASDDYDTAPYGAGLCVRKQVAYKFMDLVRDNTQRMSLGVRGKELARADDIDLALTACDTGLGMGIFTKLKLTHLIPAFRLEKDYLLKLSEGNGYSKTMLEYVRGKKPVVKKTWEHKLIEFYRLCKMRSFDRAFYKAYARGHLKALKEITQ